SMLPAVAEKPWATNAPAKTTSPQGIANGAASFSSLITRAPRYSFGFPVGLPQAAVDCSPFLRATLQYHYKNCSYVASQKKPTAFAESSRRCEKFHEVSVTRTCAQRPISPLLTLFHR